MSGGGRLGEWVYDVRSGRLPDSRKVVVGWCCSIAVLYSDACRSGCHRARRAADVLQFSAALGRVCRPPPLCCSKTLGTRTPPRHTHTCRHIPRPRHMDMPRPRPPAYAPAPIRFFRESKLMISFFRGRWTSSLLPLATVQPLTPARKSLDPDRCRPRQQ